MTGFRDRCGWRCSIALFFQKPGQIMIRAVIQIGQVRKGFWEKTVEQRVSKNKDISHPVPLTETEHII